MIRPRKDSASGPKLSPEARQKLIERIVAGDSNPQILAYLRDAGFPADLSRTPLAHYRKLPEVTIAITDINLEHSQAAHAVPGRRIRILSRVISSLEKRLGLADYAPSTSRLASQIETGQSSPLESDCSSDTDAERGSSGAELSVREFCDLIKTLVLSLSALEQLLTNTSSRTGQMPTLAGMEAFDGKARLSQVETKASKRALFNDMLEEAIKEEEEERRRAGATTGEVPEL